MVSFALKHGLRQRPGTLLLFFLGQWLLGLAQAQPEPIDDRAALREFLSHTIRDANSFEDRFDAEVWLLDMQNRLTPFIDTPEERLALLREVHHAATQSELPPELVLAVIEVESSFDRFAISRVGAQGLMQVMPFWKNEIGRDDDNLTQTTTNLNYGCRILQYYLQRESGNLRRALAAYNGSLGSHRYSDKVYRAWANRWRTLPLDW
ncbi:lytic transglycosylase, catalytic [Luminiphilus syltensis NOR5-1B]|uniref:Lytic transglycosylase, catalytic n=1 Tax=Luminiphilus syltensis NOR5-1B TaxID=565045 RepID=B8KSK6_9GAMM|nr:transglycosylase SLT domain-containing protein [Luminiphilus syltensis]EED34470.1 lytic transglycosylase, catalytic [Luminiphilus syltensis NOR5-1B]